MDAGQRVATLILHGAKFWKLSTRFGVLHERVIARMGNNQPYLFYSGNISLVPHERWRFGRARIPGYPECEWDHGLIGSIDQNTFEHFMSCLIED